MLRSELVFLTRTMARETALRPILGLIAIAISLQTGCATIIHGPQESIAVTSSPPGAKVVANTGETCMTPGDLKLKRDTDHVLSVSMSGYQTQEKKVESNFDPLFLGNLLLGGVVGMAVDLSTGSATKLATEKVNFDLAPAAATPPAPYAASSPNSPPPGPRIGPGADAVSHTASP